MKRTIISAMTAGALSLLLSQGAFCGEDVILIANKGVKATEVSADDLREVFSGNKTSLKDGSKISPATLKAGATHEAFLKEYVGKTDAAFRAGWRKLVFTGQGAMPKTFDAESAMVDYVANTPGALGYISNGTAHGAVKSIAIK